MEKNVDKNYKKKLQWDENEDRVRMTEREGKNKNTTMTMRMCKQRKWQEKFVKELPSMTGYEMAHAHTDTHARTRNRERWMESSLKSNQCPIDFDTFRGLRGIHSIVYRHLSISPFPFPDTRTFWPK